jgi:hypothetical protein
MYKDKKILIGFIFWANIILKHSFIKKKRHTAKKIVDLQLLFELNYCNSVK